MIARGWEAYRFRLKRRRFLLRALRKRSQLEVVADRTATIEPGAILAFVCLRNEALRLPFFLDHYRRLGVDHFLVVDNDSDDGSAALLADQSDVSLWATRDSYKAARFGMDWLGWLQLRFGHGHWCLTVDADEVLIYPDWENRRLPALTSWLAARDIGSFGAVLLDLFPKGPISGTTYAPGDDPAEALGWFDPTLRRQPNPTYWNDWVQGGIRDRRFFADRPERAPTLNKVPLVHWRRPYTYVTSTHHMLPRSLNRVYDTQVAGRPSGVLLHSKFLPNIGPKSAEELDRGQHFENGSLYQDYYAALIADPDLWDEGVVAYRDWQQLVELGLMSKGDW